MKNKINLLIVVTGLVIGAAAVVLTKLGNPANMGFCVACFIRDIAGATKLHSAAVVQYFRPEIVGIVFGSLIMAIATKEFRAKAGSSPVTRFALGFIVMIGALLFLGCPLRMVIRMGGGDINAFVGLLGFIIGILIGILFLKKGFSLKRNYDVGNGEGFALPIILIIFIIILFSIGYYSATYLTTAEKFASGVDGVKNVLFPISLKGPGSMHAPFIFSFVIALIVGALAQKSRMCMVGGIRDVVMFKNFELILGFIAVFVAVLIGNIIAGKAPVFTTIGKPIAHSNQLYNLVGMIIVGWGSCLLGGCPLRQLILAGEGNADSAITIFGMLVGAAFAHNFGLAGGADTAATADMPYKVFQFEKNPQIVTIICIVVLLFISVINIQKEEK